MIPASKLVPSPVLRAARGARVLRAVLTLVRDLDKLDDVIDLGRNLVDEARLEEIVSRVRHQPRAADAFARRPRVSWDTAGLLAYPEGTLGRELGEFLRARNLDPGALPEYPAHNDAWYLRAHLYETHDMWHLITGFDTDPAGELGLQAFYVAQIRAPLGLALMSIGLLNTVLYSIDDTDARLDAIARGWRMGKQAEPLFGMDWTAQLSRSLADVRAELGLAKTG